DRGCRCWTYRTDSLRARSNALGGARNANTGEEVPNGIGAGENKPVILVETGNCGIQLRPAGRRNDLYRWAVDYCGPKALKLCRDGFRLGFRSSHEDRFAPEWRRCW